MNRCAFLSMDNLQAFECYDHLLYKPFEKEGWEVKNVSWRNNKVNWDYYDAVIVRSSWDYQKEPSRFLEVIKKIDSSSARLANSLEIIGWNIDKSYLKELSEKNISVFPTIQPPHFSPKNLTDYFSFFKTDEIVIKPLIGASADDTFWLHKNASVQPLQALEKAFNHTSFMVQP